MHIQLFSYIDGSYYALHIIRELLSQEGSSGIGHNYDPSNTLDLLRVLTVPDEDILTEAKSTHTRLLVIPENSHNSDLPESDNEDTDDDDDDESVNGDNDYYTQANTPIDSTTSEKGHNSDSTSTLSKKRKADLDLLAQLSNTSALKRKKQLDTDNNNLTTTNTTIKRRLPLSKRVYILSYHKRIFSKCWLLLLSSPPEHPLSLPHHRTILKHLPEHILPYFNKPLLLSEYLTICYKYGGIISILSLESIFILITKYNFDYPNFFLSLYHLCIPETFSAKYRSKFLNLLSISLKSTNIEKHTIAAFIKRLSILTLCIPIYSTLYCIALITSLLREHPECLVLLHRLPTTITEKGHNSDPSTTNTTTQEYNNDNNITDLQYTNSLSYNTSLYELDLLQLHYSSLISDMCITIQNNIHSTLKPGTVIYPTTSTNTSTTNSTTSITTTNSNIDRIIVQNQPILMSEYIHQTYDSILEVELKKSNKKIVPLASIKPFTLFASNNNNNNNNSTGTGSTTISVSTSINNKVSGASGASAAAGSKHSISNTSSKGGGGESGRGIVSQLFGG